MREGKARWITVKEFFFGADNTLPYAALELLGGEEKALVRLSGDGRILRLTKCAEEVLKLSAMELVFGVLAPVHRQQLRDMLASHKPCSFLEKFHGTSLYEVTAIPTEEGALLLLTPWEKQTAMDLRLQLDMRSWIQNIEIAAFLQRGQQPETYDTIHRQVCRIERLLEHIEFMKQSAEQRLQPAFQRSSLTELCMRAAAEFMEASGIPVEVSVPEQLFVVCDEKLLLRALLNLLTNAKQASRIWISVSHRPDHTGGSDGIYIIKVEDNGPGVPMEEIDTLYHGWKKTVSLDNLHRFGEESQPGLGIPLVHLVAEYHYGSLLYEQRKEGGARFIFSFPDGLMADPFVLECMLEPDYDRLIKNELSVLDEVREESRSHSSLEG